MNDKNKIVISNSIKDTIFSFRGLQVMIDKDLSVLYEVETKVLNQAVKRNIDRFPIDFRFQLSDIEKDELVTNCDRFGKLKHSTHNPYAFTEQGVAMLAGVLRSEIAINVSIKIMRAFVEMKKFISANVDIFQRISRVEQKQFETDKKVDEIFQAFETNNLPTAEGIYYDGQIFDAYAFVSKLIKSANKSILLIDNYIDESVLLMLAKRTKGVSSKIYTSKITKQLKLDLQKFNSQYPKIIVTTYNKSHDRFLIIDNKELYHIGASLKDLGKKWFAFSKIDIDINEMIKKLED